MIHQHRKLFIITGTVALIAIVEFAFFKATFSPDSTPTAVTTIKQNVAPNKIFESYQYPYDLQIIHADAKLYSAPAGTTGSKYMGTVETNHLTSKIVGKKRADLNHQR